jgi:hypothetical protein
MAFNVVSRISWSDDRNVCCARTDCFGEIKTASHITCRVKEEKLTRGLGLANIDCLNLCVPWWWKGNLSNVGSGNAAQNRSPRDQCGL